MTEPETSPPVDGDAEGMPRWVKVFLIVGAVLLAVFLISLAAGVRHGPGMHTPGGPGEHSPPIEHSP